MKFAEPLWLIGSLLGIVVALFLIVGAVLLVRAIRAFGDEARVQSLVTSQASTRRAVKGALLVSSVALAFVALAQPQYGRGSRLIPATNLDVVIVLDFSKSMYAQDVKPSRISRAKAEVGELIRSLPGARFGAVAFAGQPMSFPLTSDGAAIAQFFRQMSPNDMPVGGTAIARALEAGRDLLSRDPKSQKHERVILLVTDGEDLEGDPVSIAQAARADDTTIHVVQIGGRTPEPLPEVDDSGEVKGWRTDEDGQPITTSLSADGEAQLGKIAEVSGGRVVRSERGSTGLAEIEGALKQRMTEELSERVETVYADVFAYPLALAILLLVIETFVSEARRRSSPDVQAPGRRRSRKKPKDVQRAALASLLALCVAALGTLPGCEGKWFMRNAPAVDQAISALDAGDASAAVDLLQNYLSTGNCQGGEIGTPARLREKPSASFDLGLGLFQLAEKYGKRFGDEELGLDAGAASPEDEAALANRKSEAACALAIVGPIASDASVPVDLRARASYLAGNLNFLLREYRAAVDAYDAALKLIPGLPADAGVDGIGRDAAWNRAIALRREEEQDERDAGADAAPDGAPEGGSDGGDSGPDAGDDGGAQDSGADPDSGAGEDGGADGSSPPNADGGADAGRDSGSQPPPPDNPQESSSANQDERMLDMLEQAPTFQEEAAKNSGLRRGVNPMQDK